MFKAQKDFLRTVATTDKQVLPYFPRQMGKTYVRKYLKKIGASKEAPVEPEEGKHE